MDLTLWVFLKIYKILGPMWTNPKPEVGLETGSRLRMRANNENGVISVTSTKGEHFL